MTRPGGRPIHAGVVFVDVRYVGGDWQPAVTPRYERKGDFCVH